MNEAIRTLASRGDTPAYIFDIDAILEKARTVKRALMGEQHIQICYAMKANPFIIKEINSVVDKYEVCSPGELCICKKNEIDMAKIVLSGVNKEEQDILQALEWGVQVFTIESLAQLELLQKCASAVDKQIQVLVRLTSGNQFGMDEGTLIDVIRRREEYDALLFEGIQYYSGTQKNTNKLAGEVEKLGMLCKMLQQECGFVVKEVEYGPGLAIDYFGRAKESENVLEKCREALLQLAESGVRLTLEMGRFLVAECGKYITKVVDIKRNQDSNYCIVDGGIHHVNYYGQVMGVKVPPMQYYKFADGYEKASEINLQEKGENWCICGSLCTVADVLVRAASMEDLRIGDLFVFEKIGAYSVTEGIYLFLSRRMPAIYFMQAGKLQLQRAACETYHLNCCN